MLRTTSSCPYRLSESFCAAHICLIQLLMAYSTTHFEEGLKNLPLKEINVMQQELIAQCLWSTENFIKKWHLPKRNGGVHGTASYQLAYCFFSSSFFFPLQSIKVMYLLLNFGLVFHPATAHRHVSRPKHALSLSWSFFFLEKPWPALPLLYIIYHSFKHTLPEQHCPWQTPLGWAGPPSVWITSPTPQNPAGLLLSSLTNPSSASP